MPRSRTQNRNPLVRDWRSTGNRTSAYEDVVPARTVCPIRSAVKHWLMYDMDPWIYKVVRLSDRIGICVRDSILVYDKLDPASISGYLMSIDILDDYVRVSSVYTGDTKVDLADPNCFQQIEDAIKRAYNGKPR